MKFKAWDKLEKRYRDDVVLGANGNPHILRTSLEFEKLVTELYKQRGSTFPEGNYYEIDFTDHYGAENIEIQILAQ